MTSWPESAVHMGIHPSIFLFPLSSLDSLRPHRHAILPIRLIAQVRRGGRAHAGADRGARLAVVADRVDPVLQVQELAVRRRVEIAASGSLAKYLLLRLVLRERPSGINSKRRTSYGCFAATFAASAVKSAPRNAPSSKSGNICGVQPKHGMPSATSFFARFSS